MPAAGLLPIAIAVRLLRDLDAVPLGFTLNEHADVCGFRQPLAARQRASRMRSVSALTRIVNAMSLGFVVRRLIGSVSVNQVSRVPLSRRQDSIY